MLLFVIVDMVLVLSQPNSTPKNIILAETGMMGFQKSQCHHTAPPMSLLRISYYPVGVFDGSLCGVDAGDGKGGVGNRTNHLTSQNFYC